MPDPIRAAAAEALRKAGRTPRVLVGFDGFLDVITGVVGTRRSERADDYEPMRAISELAARIGAAGDGRSTNIELRERELRAGGNGPLMSSALAALGAEVTLIGALGEDGAEPVHPVYAPLIDRCKEALSIAPSARTDALEFGDGKVMFNWPASLDGVGWDLLIERVGLERIAGFCAAADVIATVNWTNMSGLGSIWKGLRERVLPGLDPVPAVFVDLSNPGRRSDDAVRGMLGDLRDLNTRAPVTLGLNIAEAQRIAGLSIGEPLPRSHGDAEMEAAAAALREALGLGSVLVHTRGMVAGADAEGRASVRTRIVERPVLTTGAGDHFNGGYVAARARGLGLAQSLACGCDTASTYVATGKAPGLDELIEVLGHSADLG